VWTDVNLAWGESALTELIEPLAQGTVRPVMPIALHYLAELGPKARSAVPIAAAVLRNH
jgi:hypothetical protein